MVEMTDFSIPIVKASNDLRNLIALRPKDSLRTKAIEEQLQSRFIMVKAL